MKSVLRCIGSAVPNNIEVFGRAVYIRTDCESYEISYIVGRVGV